MNIAKAVNQIVKRPRGRPRGKYNGTYNYKEGTVKGRPKVEATPEILADRAERRRISKKKYADRIRLERTAERLKLKAERKAERKAKTEARRREKKEKERLARLALNLKRKAVATELKNNPELVNVLWKLTQNNKGESIEIHLRDGTVMKNIKFSNKPDPNAKTEEQIEEQIEQDLSEIVNPA